MSAKTALSWNRSRIILVDFSGNFPVYRKTRYSSATATTKIAIPGKGDGQRIILHHRPDIVPGSPLDKPEEGIGHVGYDTRPGTDEEDERERVDCTDNRRTCKDFGRDHCGNHP